jgi:hypothetical protein
MLTTLCDYLLAPLSLRLRRGGRDGKTLLRCILLCGRTGTPDRLTTLRD